ncbi:MAG: MDR family oxidoreductase [Stappiaceae bacterium]
MERFKAIWVTRDEGERKPNPAVIQEVSLDDLMPGDVTVRVEYTTVNYKDGLAITGKGPVLRKFPMVPGIDFAGEVIASDHAEYAVGDKVVLNGWGVGEVHMGAFAGVARVNGDWLIKLPDGLTTAQAASIGTAGYTAMLAVMALEDYGITANSGPVVISGAAGGVGSVAVSILSKLGYHVVASTGRTEEERFLKDLGAGEVIDRSIFSDDPRPLNKEIWAAGIDVAGSTTLANMLSMISYGGAVATCGLAQGMDLPTSVAPFILRGVSLLGIDSVMAPKAKRQAAYNRITRDLDLEKLATLTTTIGFDDIMPAAADIMAGKVRGRLLVDMSKKSG